MIEIILWLKIFIFSFCLLNILKNIFKLAKIIWLKNGKFTLSSKGQVFLAASISYIIATLIIGF